MKLQKFKIEEIEDQFPALSEEERRSIKGGGDGTYWLFIKLWRRFHEYNRSGLKKMKPESNKMSVIKKIALWLFFLNSCFCTVHAQIEWSSTKHINGVGLKSCFTDEKSGHFFGSLSGVLYLAKNGSKNTLTYNFRNEEATLRIVYDPDTVYDVSRKNYLFLRNDIKLRYTTYCLANCFEIILNGDTCSYSLIDGGCDLMIDGLERQYETKEDHESLLLTVTKDFGLWKRGRKMTSNYAVKAGSKLRFNMSRKKSITW
jgi:hypothetical protein